MPQINPGDTLTVRVQQWVSRQERMNSRTVEGVVVSRTADAIQFRGVAVIREEDHCLRCSLPIDHAASRLIGYGPICCEHLGIDWVAKADSLTPEQISEIRASVARTSQGTWWLPLRGLTIESHQQTGTPPTPAQIKATNGRNCTIKDDTAAFTFKWGCEDFDAIKDAIKGAGARWNPVAKEWTLPARLAQPLIDRFAFNVAGAVPAAAPAPVALPEAAPAAVAPAAAPAQGRVIGLIKTRYTIAWARGDKDFAALLGIVREIAGRKYDAVTFTWSVPSAAEAEVRSLALRYDFTLSPEVSALFAEKEEVAQAREALIAASHQAASQYDLGFTLPTGLAPYEYQRAYVEYAEAVNGRLIDADEMGLGKTIESALANHKLGGYPLIVVAPASVLHNWKREFNKWLPSLNVVVAKGRRLELDPADVYITNYESLSVGSDEKGVILSQTAENLKLVGAKGLIVDEAHNCKTPKAARTRAVKSVADGIQFRQCLTGTPIPNRTGELKAQLDIVGLLETFGGEQAFDKKYVKSSDPARFDKLNEKLRSLGYIRRLKSAVKADMPAKTYQTELVSDWVTGADYAAAYDNLVELATSGGSMANQLAELTRMRTILGQRKIGPTVAWAADFLNLTDDKLVITAYHQEVQRGIYEALVERFPHIKVAHLFSSDSIIRRQENVDLFQTDPECRVIVISLKAGGVGITLHAAHDLIHVEQDWVPANMDQASDRIHRDGQQFPCLITEFLADASIDTILKRAQSVKIPEINASTQGATDANYVQQTVVKAVIAELVSQHRIRKAA